MLGCTIYGIREGDVPKMMAPYDGQNNFCGIKVGNNTEFVGYGKLYFPKLESSSHGDLAISLFSNAVCVKKCPKAFGEAVQTRPGQTSLTAITKTIEIVGYCIPLNMSAEQSKVFNTGFN
jgi:hypothetical protein